MLLKVYHGVGYTATLTFSSCSPNKHSIHSSQDTSACCTDIDILTWHYCYNVSWPLDVTLMFAAMQSIYSWYASILQDRAAFSLYRSIVFKLNCLDKVDITQQLHFQNNSDHSQSSMTINIAYLTFSVWKQTKYLG